LDSAPSSPGPQPAPHRTRGRGRLWQGLGGIAISIFFLYWALRGVSPAAFFRELRRADLGLFLASAAVATLTFPARASRWRIILAARSAGVRWKPVWHATAIGFMANNVLPARAGELARAYAGSRLVGLPFAASLGSVAVERVFDGLIVVLLMAVALALADFPTAVTLGSTSVSTIAGWMGGVFILILAFLFVLVHAPRESLAWVAAALRRSLPAPAAEWIVRVTRGFIEGLSILRAPRDFARVVIWSLAVWLINGAAFYLGFLAFHINGLPLTSPLLLQGIVAIGVAIPSSPGFFGLFEAGSRVSLGLYGVPGVAAASFALGTHLGWFVPITAIGLFHLARSGLSLRDITRPEPAR
jgi:glycosyltransferase 2 family protein